ncbi:hypothetical protein C8R47DRAFT_1209149 [Mycena vitilis]|nr:hypothetical protein C8R47DRAFT_1209149 [Mycena vitilis]
MLSTPLLRSRVMKAWSIHNTWRENLVEPRRVRVVPVKYEIRRFLCIPWTHAMVVLVDDDLFLLDSSSGARVSVPIFRGTSLLTISMKLFWRDSEHGFVLVVHCLDGPSELGESKINLQLFALDLARMSVSFLTSVLIPHSVSEVDLRGDHLAVMGHTTQPRASVIRSFHLVFVPNCSAHIRAVIRIKAPVTFGAASFAIIDARRFVLASRRGLVVYRLSTAALQSPGICAPWLRPVWTHIYSEPDILPRPPLGPVLTRTDGAISFSISSGAYLRCVLMTPGRPNSYAVTEKRLVDKVPVYFGISTGFRVGVYRRPCSTPAFITFSITSRKASMHPFFYEGDHRASAKGSVIFQFDVMDSLEAGTLQVDEEQGRILFLVRSHAKPVAKIIILELV